jgi:hypothetical protein
MTAWWLAGIAWFITTLVVVPVAFVVAVVAAGPHSSVLPSTLAPIVWIACWCSVVVVPAVAAWKMFQWTRS